ncbi:hypothetical protein N8I74_15760 [Chitiniphilus purpureus]|uniref:DNA transfer protein p32 n=1 Tax=Chitiniphilus purpureus TaxID=2981137 RepID=A0ABY6DK65_9NEIS|nr:hypothetical protein [Chitiniphilus sp. CD1]UXY14759.1 hypothetical protein N8I74_15760 [Chitiniphilus sp. CD1]
MGSAATTVKEACCERQEKRYLSAGIKPGGDLVRSFTMRDYQADPGYQFRLQQGTQAIDRALASRGLFNSGKAVKDLTEYSQGLASDEFGNAFNRFQLQQGNRYNRLAGVAGVGQTAVNQLGQAGQNYASQVGQNITNAASNMGNAMMQGANARASGYVGTGNALSGAIGQGINYWQQQQALDGGQPQYPIQPYNQAAPNGVYSWFN